MPQASYLDGGDTLSGSIGSGDIGSGVIIDFAKALIDGSFLSAEILSGPGMAVALTTSGALQLAMAGNPNRMPTAVTGFDWTLIEKHGVGVAVMVFLLTAFAVSLTAIWIGCTKMARWVGNNFVLPIKERHVMFLDRTEQAVQQQTLLGVKIENRLSSIDGSLVTQVLQNEKIQSAIKDGACRTARPTQIALPLIPGKES